MFFQGYTPYENPAESNEGPTKTSGGLFMAKFLRIHNGLLQYLIIWRYEQHNVDTAIAWLSDVKLPQCRLLPTLMLG